MRVFITGATGFIGTYLISELIRNGVYVIAFDIAPMPKQFAEFKDNLTYIRGDLTDRLDLYRAVTQSKPTHILHLGSILAGPCEDNPSKGFDVNFNSTISMLDAAHANGVERFVFTSSIAVFGTGLQEPVGDDDVKIPANVYGQTKLAGEHLIEWYDAKGKISCGGVRFPWVFGPGRTTGITALWSSKLLDQVARGQKVEIENPDQVGNWLYVKDAVKALMLMLGKRSTPRIVYNIMGSAHTIKEVIEKARLIQPKFEVEYGEGGNTESPYPSLYDDGNARRELGWEPDYEIDAAIKEHLEVMSAHSGRN